MITFLRLITCFVLNYGLLLLLLLSIIVIIINEKNFSYTNDNNKASKACHA